MSAVLQAAALEVVSAPGRAAHLRTAQAQLRARRDDLARLVSRHLPEGTLPRVPAGGLNLWLRLPGDASATEVAERCALAGLLVSPGGRVVPHRADRPLPAARYRDPSGPLLERRASASWRASWADARRWTPGHRRTNAPMPPTRSRDASSRTSRGRVAAVAVGAVAIASIAGGAVAATSSLPTNPPTDASLAKMTFITKTITPAPTSTKGFDGSQTYVVKAPPERPCCRASRPSPAG